MSLSQIAASTFTSGAELEQLPESEKCNTEAGFRYQSSEAEEGVGLTWLSEKHAESVQSMLRRYSDIVSRSDFGLLWNWMEYALVQHFMLASPFPNIDNPYPTYVKLDKDLDFLHDMLAELSWKFPALASVFVDKADTQ